MIVTADTAQIAARLARARVDHVAIEPSSAELRAGDIALPSSVEIGRE